MKHVESGRIDDECHERANDCKVGQMQEAQFPAIAARVDFAALCVAGKEFRSQIVLDAFVDFNAAKLFVVSLKICGVPRQPAGPGHKGVRMVPQSSHQQVTCGDDPQHQDKQGAPEHYGPDWSVARGQLLDIVSCHPRKGCEYPGG